MRSASKSGKSSDHPSPESVLEAELAAIYDRTVDDIYRFCISRSGDAELAADITADVFFAAARAFANGTGAHVNRPWLFTVAKNRLVDHWRRSTRHDRRLKQLEQLGGRALNAVDLSDEISTVAAADVIEALQSLPDRQRAALSLRYLEERSVAEIADDLSITYSAAESLLARGRRSFERAWAAQAEDAAEGTSRP